MKLKVLALALAFSPLAEAATVEQTYNLGAYGANIDYADIFTAARPVGSLGPVSFSHFLNFTITEPLFAGSTVTELSLGNLVDISNLQASIYQGSCLLNVCTGGPTAYAAFTAAAPGFLELSQTFAAGNYYVQASGYITGSVSGKYTLAATTVPVPEPETWGMLLAGLGVLGLAVRRKAHGEANA